MDVLRKRIKLPDNLMRKTVGEIDLEDLVKSINDVGLINPILVRKRGEDYELIAGLRRLMAADVLKLEKVTVRVVKAGEEKAEKMKVDENRARENVGPIDEGQYFIEVMEKHAWKQKDLAKKFRVSESYVSQRISAVTWPDCLRKVVENGQLIFSVAREFSGIRNISEMERVIDQAIRGGVSPAVAARWRHEINRETMRTEAGEAGAGEYMGEGSGGVYLYRCDICGNRVEDENQKMKRVCDNCVDVIKIGQEKGVFIRDEEKGVASGGEEVER